MARMWHASTQTTARSSRPPQQWLIVRACQIGQAHLRVIRSISVTSGGITSKRAFEQEEGWVPATQYSVRLGGVAYQNVRKPIVVNGEAPIEFWRNTDTSELGVTFQLQTEDGAPIARVQHNRILDLADAYLCLRSGWGLSVIERANGRVWCDLRTSPVNHKYELDCSFLLFALGGYPLLFHPDRTMLGAVHGDNQPNIAGLTMDGSSATNATAIHFDGAGFYIVDVAIVDFAIGIDVSYRLDSK